MDFVPKVINAFQSALVFFTTQVLRTLKEVKALFTAIKLLKSSGSG